MDLDPTPQSPFRSMVLIYCVLLLQVHSCLTVNIQNGYTEYSMSSLDQYGDQYPENTVATFNCYDIFDLPLYVLVGPHKSTCKAGKWVPEVHPRCVNGRAFN